MFGALTTGNLSQFCSRCVIQIQETFVLTFVNVADNNSWGNERLDAQSGLYLVLLFKWHFSYFHFFLFFLEPCQCSLTNGITFKLHLFMVLIACHLPEGNPFSFISLFLLSPFSGQQQVEECVRLHRAGNFSAQLAAASFRFAAGFSFLPW